MKEDSCLSNLIVTFKKTIAGNITEEAILIIGLVKFLGNFRPDCIIKDVRACINKVVYHLYFLLNVRCTPGIFEYIFYILIKFRCIRIESVL